MSLHDMIQADAVNVFANTDDFAEAATYHKRDGSSRSINVVVDRQALQTLQADGDNNVPSFEVQVPNDSTYGITSDELKEGAESIEFATRVGITATRRTIVKMLSHDEGMLTLECQ